MDILIAIVYIILFLILMVFVFSIGMLKPFMPKKEIALVLVVAFIIGSIGGAFFLEPLYQEFPAFAGEFEKNVPGNEETLYLDLSSATNIGDLKQNLSQIDGFKSFNETGITFFMWSFNDQELAYFNDVIGNIDSHYGNYTVDPSGKININLEPGYNSNSALQSFSNWYKLVYGDSIAYAQIHAKLVVSSSSLDKFENALLERGIVANHIDGPVQNVINQTNSSMLSYNQFVAVSGVVGVIVSIIGIYFDNVIVGWRKFKKFIKR
ncbi:hypothetical protein [uncultured Methanobrevibacter sp.]|uniref:hypothetical protein n=1 Tax=uncultured Methanobrevibacter sp. TaxID=253161 RepID=UPI00261CF95C|nr:hypothetical protein [uncultured Methanobrevibacter sp.]